MLFRALLLLVTVCQGQTIRVSVAPTPSITAPVPTISPVSPAMALTPMALAPSLASPLSLSIAAPVPPAIAALAIAAPAKAQPPKAAKAALAAAALPATPADGWASRFNFQPGSEFFDGAKGGLRDQTGAVFDVVSRPDGIRLHIVEDGPDAPRRQVPGTEGLTGKELLSRLNELTGRGYIQHEYKESSKYLFSKADNVVINGKRGVVDAYSGIFVPGTSDQGGDYPEPGDPNGDGFPDRAGMNVEHTWPQSLFNRALPMRSDLHHLMATFMHPNSVRGALPFGMVRGTPDYENKAGAKRGDGVFEPPDAAKGRVARKLLYFYTRYKDTRAFGRTSAAFWNRQIPILLEWNRAFPPSAAEARFNDLVEEYQGNRNPYIDDASLADRIGAEGLRAGMPERGVMARRQGGNPRSSRRSRRR